MMGDTYDTYKEIAEVVWERQRIMITMSIEKNEDWTEGVLSRTTIILACSRARCCGCGSAHGGSSGVCCLERQIL
eukprot:SAG31_NODE_48_length_30945_cov_16.254263_25_plen_75_part_00